jgi:HlyD family secretion protein
MPQVTPPIAFPADDREAREPAPPAPQAMVPRRQPRRFLGLLVGLILLAAVVGAIIAVMSYARNSKGIAAEDFDLRLGKAEVADIQVAVSEVGAIEPVVKVDVKSSLSGRVTDLLAREGDRVRRGQVLARVEPDVNQAQTLSEVRSGLNMTEIKARDAERDLQTNTRLHEEGFVSDQQLKDARVKFETAREDLEAARTKMRIVVESGIPLDQPISTTQRVNIVSPMDGVVIRKNVEVGQTVTSGVSSFNEGTVLYAVADVGSMLIKASINEVDIGRVRLRSPVVVTVDAFPYKRFDGTVSHISPSARLKDKIKVFDIEIALARQVPEFRAGMTANVEVRGDRVEKTLSVPVEAIFKKNEREVVYALKPRFDEPRKGEKAPRKGKSDKYDISETWQRFFEERDVKVGLVSLERAQILAGLTDGEAIALENPTRPRQIEDED